MASNEVRIEPLEGHVMPHEVGHDMAPGTCRVVVTLADGGHLGFNVVVPEGHGERALAAIFYALSKRLRAQAEEREPRS